MTDQVWLRPRRPPVAGPVPRCEACGAEGVLELAPGLDGRPACPPCRYTERRRLAALLAAETRRRLAK